LPGEYKDVPYAGLFILNNIILVGLLAGTYDEAYFKSPTTTTSGTADPNSAMASVVAAAVVTGIILCIGWIAALQTCPSTLIQAGLAFGVFAPCVMGFYVLSAGNVFGFLIFELMAALGLCYWYCVQSRIALAAKMIEITSKFLQKHYTLVAIALVNLFACIGFMLVWCLSLYCTLKSQGLLTETTTPGNTTAKQLDQAGGLTLFYFFLSYFWGINVFCNTLHVTTAGSFADWWLQVTPLHCKRTVDESMTTDWGGGSRERTTNKALWPLSAGLVPPRSVVSAMGLCSSQSCRL